MALDKALPEKFVFAVIKKELAADLHKKRFDLVRDIKNETLEKKKILMI